MPCLTEGVQSNWPCTRDMTMKLTIATLCSGGSLSYPRIRGSPAAKSIGLGRLREVEAVTIAVLRDAVESVRTKLERPEQRLHDLPISRS